MLFPRVSFDNQLFMRSGDKAELIHHLVKLVPECIISSLPKGLQYVIDEGGLLHKFSRPKHSTYAEICAMYTQHITQGYDLALLVFDGYHGPSTKDEVVHRKKNRQRCWRFGVSLLGNAPNDEQEGISIKRKE